MKLEVILEKTVTKRVVIEANQDDESFGVIASRARTEGAKSEGWLETGVVSIRTVSPL